MPTFSNLFNPSSFCSLSLSLRRSILKAKASHDAALVLVSTELLIQSFVHCGDPEHNGFQRNVPNAKLESDVKSHSQKAWSDSKAPSSWNREKRRSALTINIISVKFILLILKLRKNDSNFKERNSVYNCNLMKFI